MGIMHRLNERLPATNPSMDTRPIEKRAWVPPLVEVIKLESAKNTTAHCSHNDGGGSPFSAC
jgi:hypothetical protein